MRRILFALGLLAVPSVLSAQSDADRIERALAAAPARASDAATVIKWNSDHSYETIREGSNSWVCYDRSGEPGRAAFAVQCTSIANLDRVSQSRRFEAESASREEMQQMLAVAEADGSRVLPEYGSMWISMNGADMESARMHRTIAVPGATTASTGLPDNGRQGGAWIMDAGTSTAHIMIPGT